MIRNYHYVIGYYKDPHWYNMCVKVEPASSFLRGQSHPGQQNYAVIHMTCRENYRLEKQMSPEKGPPYTPRISWWRETPLVIGVKEKCASCLSWGPLWHPFLQSDPNVIRLLNHSYCHLLLTLCTHALNSWLHLSSASLCAYQRAGLMNFPRWLGLC